MEQWRIFRTRDLLATVAPAAPVGADPVDRAVADPEDRAVADPGDRADADVDRVVPADADVDRAVRAAVTRARTCTRT